MAKFDWNKYDDADDVQEQAPSGFDWNQFDDDNDSILPSMDTALETGQDFLTGASQGATLGAADELGGAASAGIETILGKLGIGPAAIEGEIPVGELPGLTPELKQKLAGQTVSLPEESFLDKYRQYQEAGEQSSALAKERSPYAEFAGQLGGAVMASGALGLNRAAIQGPKALFTETVKNQGMSKAALDLLRGTATTGSRIVDAGTRGAGMFGAAAPALAVESAMTSKSDIVGPNADLGGVAQDVGLGLSFGLPAMVGLNVATEVPGAIKERVGKNLDKVKDKVAAAFQDEGNPRLRQMAKSFQEYGRELGVSPRSHAHDIGGLKFSQRDSKAATQLLDVVNSADTNLGQSVRESIEKATARGALVDVSDDITAAAQRVNDLVAELPDLGTTRKSAMAFDKILNGMPQLTPTEVKNLIDDLDAAIGTFKSATNKDAAAVGTLNELLRYRKSVADTFKKAVPEYAQAAQRFEGFREVLEQLISGDRPADVTQVFYGNLRQQDQKIYDRVLDMVQNVQKTGQSSQPYRTAFTNFMDSLEGFQGQELKRGAQQVIPSAESIRKFLLNASDDAALRGSVRTTTESRSVKPDWKEMLIGKAPESGAYLAGKATKSFEKLATKPIVKQTADMARGVYRAPAQAISNLASKLETSGQFSQIGKSLREAVENGDTAKKNAALFTIMQNPNSRAFISAEDFPDVEEQE